MTLYTWYVLILLSFLSILYIFCAILGPYAKRENDLFYLHAVFAWLTVIFTLITIYVIEVMVHSSGRGDRGWIFWIHLPIAIGFTYTLIRLLYINGRRNPARHKKLVSWNKKLFIGMLITGAILLYQFTERSNAKNISSPKAGIFY